MRIIISNFSLALVLAGVSAAAASSNESNLPVTHVRSLGMRALREAHTKARLMGRRMQDSDGDFDSTYMMEMLDEDGGEGDVDFDSMFDFGEDGEDGDMDYLDGLFGGDEDGGMGSMMGMVCAFLPMVTEDPTFKEEMAKQGMTCSKFGCDDDSSHLIMNCEIEGEICSTDGPATLERRLAAPEAEEFCVKDSSVEMSMELDFEDESEVVTKQCTTYTKPDYMATLGEGCITMRISMDLGALMEDTMDNSDPFGEDPEMTPEEAAEKAMEYITIDECSGEFSGGSITCECGLCDGGMGFELTCSNGLVTEECNDFDASTLTDSVSGGAQPGVPHSDGDNASATSAVSVVRFTQAPEGVEGSSPAASHTQAAATGVVLALASYIAAM